MSFKFLRKSSSSKFQSLHQLVIDNDVKEIDVLFTSFNNGEIKQKKIVKFLEEHDTEGQAPIHQAMKSTSEEVVKLFLDFYKKHSDFLDINKPDDFGYTPLHCIITNNHISPSIIKSMLNDFTHLKVDVGNRDQNLPLHFFCKSFASIECTEIGELMIRRAGDRIVNMRNQQKETPLHKAIFNDHVRLLMLDLLIKHRVDINCPNDKNETCLHYAVRLQRKDLIVALINAGAKVDVKGSDGKTPFEVALSIGNSDISDYMQSVQDLTSWAKHEGIDDEHLKVFIKEELFLDVLSDATDELLDGIGITATGAKMKIINASKKLNKDNKSMRSTSSRTLNPLLDSKLDTSMLRSSLSRRKKNGEMSNSIDDLIVNQDEVEFTKKLAEGRSGKIFKGIYKKNEVAIKVLKSSNDIEEFKKEFLIISSVKSPFVVQFFGVLLEPQLAMVMEFCNKGSLYDVMLDTKNNFDWTTFFKATIQMCQGIEHLHSLSPPIVHRDLKSLNLLVNNDGNVLLADFGLSRFSTESNAETLMKVCGTIAYAAPEILISASSYYPKCDVYSIGMVIWEVLMRAMTGEYQRPYAEYPTLKYDFMIVTKVAEGLRPTMPGPTPPSVKDLIVQCWHQDLDSRPTTSEVVSRLRKAEETYQKEKEIWDGLCRSAHTVK